jgi:hypothetical protein
VKIKDDVFKFINRRLGGSGSTKKSTIKRLKKEFKGVKKFKGIKTKELNRAIKQVTNENLNKKLSRAIKKAPSIRIPGTNEISKAYTRNLESALYNNQLKKFGSLEKKEKYFREALRKLKQGQKTKLSKIGFNSKNIHQYGDEDTDNFYHENRDLIIGYNKGYKESSLKLKEAYKEFKVLKREKEDEASNKLAMDFFNWKMNQ